VGKNNGIFIKKIFLAQDGLRPTALEGKSEIHPSIMVFSVDA
jgi:hypothetical protein